VVGANLVVEGAVQIAEALGLDRLVIGLTVVALGTSLPELATSIVAAFRGERDLAVGSIVGSNLMNILAVAGLTALATSDGVPIARAAITFDIPVMIAVAVACLPIFFSRQRIARWEGALFLGYAVAYTAYLVLEATEHRVLPAFSTVMLLFVIPLTAVTLAVITYRSLRARPLRT
jgi:cation:H+ antiporter